MDNELLSPKEVCEYFKGAIRPKTLANWRSAHKTDGPPWYTIGREIRYAKKDLDLYLEKMKRIPGEYHA